MLGKTHIGLVVVGHVDAGKSTLCGRFLFELGGMSQRHLEKLRQEAKALGKESFLFAYFMDTSQDERVRGTSIDCCTREFFTDSYRYTIIDAPGDRYYTKNMIFGASQADVALLVVPANKEQFEVSISKGNHTKIINKKYRGQTVEHAQLCYLLGIKQLIVCVNRMDEPSVNYSERRFNEIKEKLSKILTKIGYKTRKIAFIPTSGFKGDNLRQPSLYMKWYKGFKVIIKKKTINGYTLYDALEKVIICPPKRKILSEKPFKMPVAWIYKIKGIGDVVTGRVEQGTISPGKRVIFYPTGCTGKAFSIETHHKNIDKANCGDNIGVNIKGLSKDKMPKRGDVMMIDDIKLYPNHLINNVCLLFIAQIFVVDHPTKLKCGYTSTGCIRTAKTECKIIKINWKQRYSSNNKSNCKIKYPMFIEKGDTAEIVFSMHKRIIMYSFNKIEVFGRISFHQSNTLIMFGKIVDVNGDHYFLDHYFSLNERKWSFLLPNELKNMISIFLVGNEFV